MAGKPGSGQYRLISRPPLGIICNHRPPTFVCFIPPSSNDHNTMYMMLFISCLLFVCSLFNESESPPFCPGWPWRPCEWGSNEPSTSSQMMSTPLRRFLEWFIKAPTFAPLTPCSKFKQTMTKNVKYTDRIYDETCSPPDFRSNLEGIYNIYLTNIWLSSTLFSTPFRGMVESSSLDT